MSDGCGGCELLTSKLKNCLQPTVDGLVDHWLQKLNFRCCLIWVVPPWHLLTESVAATTCYGLRSGLATSTFYRSRRRPTVNRRVTLVTKGWEHGRRLLLFRCKAVSGLASWEEATPYIPLAQGYKTYNTSIHIHIPDPEQSHKSTTRTLQNKLDNTIIHLKTPDLSSKNPILLE